MTALNETHDPKRKSWVASAEGHPDFPIQNLPLGIFSPPSGEPRGGVAIGDMILDLRAAGEAGLFSGAARLAAEVAEGPTLNSNSASGSGLATSWAIQCLFRPQRTTFLASAS